MRWGRHQHRPVEANCTADGPSVPADRVHWFVARGDGGAVATLGLVLSTAILALMHRLVSAATGASQALVAVRTTTAVGGLRFSS